VFFTIIPETGCPEGYSGGVEGPDWWGNDRVRAEENFGSLDMFQKFFLPDICLTENRKQGTGCNLGMIGNGNEPPAFRMQEMNMAAGLAYRFKTKN